MDDESKHYKPNIPITKEAVTALRAKQRALDARPIKKVAEAKARKKFKAAQRLEKAMKKAEGVNATADLSEREKAQQIEKLLRKGMSSRKKRKEVKVVVAKGVHKGLKGRPKGVKGHYLMVDSRMKKEVCTSLHIKHRRLTCTSGAGKKAEGISQEKEIATRIKFRLNLITTHRTGGRRQIITAFEKQLPVLFRLDIVATDLIMTEFKAELTLHSHTLQLIDF